MLRCPWSASATARGDRRLFLYCSRSRLPLPAAGGLWIPPRLGRLFIRVDSLQNCRIAMASRPANYVLRSLGACALFLRLPAPAWFRELRLLPSSPEKNRSGRRFAPYI